MKDVPRFVTASCELQGLFPDIWSYLQTGCWEAKTTPRAICDLQKALSFLNLKVTKNCC